MYLGIVESLGDEDILQTLELLGLLTLTLDIAAVLDEDLGTLGDLLTARRDGLDGTTEGRDHLAEVGERQLGAQDEINELTALTKRSEPTRLELRIDLVGADGVARDEGDEFVAQADLLLEKVHTLLRSQADLGSTGREAHVCIILS